MPSDPGDMDDIAAVAAAIDRLEAEQRQALMAKSETLSNVTAEQVRQAVAEDDDVQREIRNTVEPSSGRRGVLKAAGVGGAAALLGGGMAGSAAADVEGTDGALDVGSQTANTYRIAGNRYGGPASARSELVSELGSDDAGARFAADDTGAEYYWTGSAWNLLPSKSASVQTGSVEDTSGNVMLASVAATGQATLASGTAVVDTGISAVDATFTLALGVDDPAADAKVTGRLFWDDSAGTYKVELVEDGTSVGNPTVNYDVVRVR